MTASRYASALLILILALSVAACEAPEPRIDRPPVVDTPGVAVDPPAELDDQLVAPEPRTLETAQALERGITNWAPNAAVRNVQGWIDRVERTDFQGRDAILAGLRDLQSELQRERLDGDRLAAVMEDLGRQTAAVGETQNRPQVERLGHVLTRSAERIRTGVRAPVTPQDGTAGPELHEQPPAAPGDGVPVPERRDR